MSVSRLLMVHKGTTWKRIAHVMRNGRRARPPIYNCGIIPSVERERTWKA